jgi:hypothetical protein
MKRFKKSIPILILSSLLTIIISSCRKQDEWLNVKRLSSEGTPKTLADYQAILNYDPRVNAYFSTFGLAGTDNIFISDTNLPSVAQAEQDGYQ